MCVILVISLLLKLAIATPSHAHTLSAVAKQHMQAPSALDFDAWLRAIAASEDLASHCVSDEAG